MLHILFVILKILGIVLVSLLALFLLILLVVLFVPIRYQLDAKKRDEIIVKMRVNWLLRIIFVRIWYINEQLHIKLRLFGIPIWDNLKPKKEKTPKSKIKKEKRKKEGQKEEEQSFEEESDLSFDKSSSKDIVKKIEEKEPLLEIKVKQNEFKDSSNVHNKSKIGKLIDKISSFFTKMKNLFQKIPKILRTIKEKVLGVKTLFANLIEKKNKIIAFFQDEKNKSGIKVAFVQVFALLRHCGPQKLKGYVKFGMEDPSTTGQLLGVASIVYAKFQGAITFEPDFENQVFEAEVMAKGRIRIISLLIIGIRLIRDKNFKELLKNVKQIKEELV